MKTLTIDLETRSDVDITASGVYRYTESPQFAILLMSVSVDGGEITTYDLALYRVTAVCYPADVGLC